MKFIGNAIIQTTKHQTRVLCSCMVIICNKFIAIWGLSNERDANLEPKNYKRKIMKKNKK